MTGVKQSPSDASFTGLRCFKWVDTHASCADPHDDEIQLQWRGSWRILAMTRAWLLTFYRSQSRIVKEQLKTMRRNSSQPLLSCFSLFPRISTCRQRDCFVLVFFSAYTCTTCTDCLQKKNYAAHVHDTGGQHKDMQKLEYRTRRAARWERMAAKQQEGPAYACTTSGNKANEKHER